MVWIRYGKIRAIWKCTTTRGYDTKYHAVGVSIKDEYERKPEEDIDSWVNRLGAFVAKRMCQNACGSLSTSVFCDDGSTQAEIVYTSEMLVTRPILKEEKAKIEKVKPEKIEEEKIEEEKIEEEKIEEEKIEEEKVPKIILEQLDILEKRLSELEKKKNEINSYVAIAKGAIERIKESGDVEKLSGQEDTLKRLIEELTRQNIIIRRQKDAIDKLKSRYGLK